MIDRFAFAPRPNGETGWVRCQNGRTPTVRCLNRCDTLLLLPSIFVEGKSLIKFSGLHLDMAFDGQGLAVRRKTPTLLDMQFSKRLIRSSVLQDEHISVPCAGSRERKTTLFILGRGSIGAIFPYCL